MHHFIHIPKTGGTSLIHDERLNISYTTEDDLSDQTKAGIEKYINPYRHSPLGTGRDDVNKDRQFVHARYRDLKHHDRKYFSIVRNPWSRMVSRWGQNHYIKSRYPERFPDYKVGNLEYFIKSRNEYPYNHSNYTWLVTAANWHDQTEYLIDDNSNLVVDVLRHEHFRDDVKSYLGHYPLHKNRNRIIQNNYREYYDDKTIQLVADLYKRDIETFDFDFDTAARKNYWNDR